MRARRRSSRAGLTLIELLVVVAIIVVVVAILMPTIAAVRRVAMNAVCTSRLRELTTACNLFRNDTAEYPSRLPDPQRLNLPGPIDELLPPAALHTPDDIPADLLNNLGRYLRFPPVSGQTTALDLPPTVQCPTVEDIEAGRDEVLLMTTMGEPLTSFYTGYGYFGRLGDDVPASRGGDLLTFLRGDRPAASRKNVGLRAVLWADDVHWSSVDGGVWQYAHVHAGRAPAAMAPLTYRSPRGLLGQHRAYTDGSVEWVSVESLGIDERGGQPALEQTASLKIGPLSLWWF